MKTSEQINKFLSKVSFNRFPIHFHYIESKFSGKRFNQSGADLIASKEKTKEPIRFEQCLRSTENQEKSEKSRYAKSPEEL